MSLDPDKQTPVRFCSHGVHLGRYCSDCDAVTPPKKMSVKEFREQGYLQELNRRFLHPLGLALEVALHEDGIERFGEVWDNREDPEGMIYGPGMIDAEKANRIDEEAKRKIVNRSFTLGFVIQPPPAND